MYVGEVVAGEINDEGNEFVATLVASNSEYFSLQTSASAFYNGGDDFSDGSSNLSDGEIAVIVVCCSVAVVIIRAAIYRKRTREARTKEFEDAYKSHFEENVANGLKFDKRISAKFNSMMKKIKELMVLIRRRRAWREDPQFRKRLSDTKRRGNGVS